MKRQQRMRKKQSARQGHNWHLVREFYRCGHGAFFSCTICALEKEQAKGTRIYCAEAIPNERSCSSDICPSMSLRPNETYTRADPQQARSTREAAPNLPIPITLTATSGSFATTKSINRVSCAAVSVRVASLKMSAPYIFAARALSRN